MVFVVFVFVVTCASWLTTTLFALTVKRVHLCRDRTLLTLQQAFASAASCPVHSSSFWHPLFSAPPLGQHGLESVFGAGLTWGERDSVNPLSSNPHVTNKYSLFCQADVLVLNGCWLPID